MTETSKGPESAGAFFSYKETRVPVDVDTALSAILYDWMTCTTNPTSLVRKGLIRQAPRNAQGGDRIAEYESRTGRAGEEPRVGQVAVSRSKDFSCVTWKASAEEATFAGGVVIAPVHTKDGSIKTRICFGGHVQPKASTITPSAYDEVLRHCARRAAALCTLITETPGQNLRRDVLKRVTAIMAETARSQQEVA